MALPPTVHKLRPGLTGSHPALGGVPAGGGGDSYTGPLDIVSGAVLAYGQRALSAAKLGTALYTMREDAGDTTQSFNSDAVTGAVSAAEITAFLAGANGFGTLWNDQGGNAKNVAQATLARQPAWLAAQSPNGLYPGFNFEGSGSGLVNLGSASNVSIGPAGLTIFVVSGNPFNADTLFGQGYETLSGGTHLDLGGLDFYNETGTTHTQFTWTRLAGSIHLLEVVTDNVSVAIALTNGANANPVATDFGFDGINYAAALGNDDAASPAAIGGVILEFILYDQVLSAPNRLSIRQNIATYYGITLS